MGCCGSARAKRRQPPKGVAVPGTERVPAEYIGDRDALFSMRGPATQTRYYVSSQPHERCVMVYVEDLPGLVARGDWRPCYGLPGEGA